MSEEFLGSLSAGYIRIDLFQVDAEFSTPSDRAEGEPARARHVKVKANSGPFRQSRLPVWPVAESHLRRILSEVARENDPQQPVSGDELVAIPLEQKRARARSESLRCRHPSAHSGLRFMVRSLAGNRSV